MRQILCIWLCWKTDSLNLKFMDEHLSRIQYRPIHLYRGRPSQKVGAYSCGSLWRPIQLPTRDSRSSNLKQLRDGGIFLLNSGKRAPVHTKLYKVYKGSGYHNQNMPPVHQYTTPTTILQPHNMSYNLQKPKTLNLH